VSVLPFLHYLPAFQHRRRTLPMTTNGNGDFLQPSRGFPAGQTAAIRLEA
jgi:hypothetical protein